MHRKRVTNENQLAAPILHMAVHVGAYSCTKILLPWLQWNQEECHPSDTGVNRSSGQNELHRTKGHNQTKKRKTALNAETEYHATLHEEVARLRKSSCAKPSHPKRETCRMLRLRKVAAPATIAAPNSAPSPSVQRPCERACCSARSAAKPKFNAPPGTPR